MSRTSGNGFAFRGKFEQESKISDDEIHLGLMRPKKFVRLSSRESINSGTQSRKSSKQNKRKHKSEITSYLKNGLLKSQDQTFRYAKAQDLQTQRRSQFTHLKPQRSPPAPPAPGYHSRIVSNGERRLRPLDPIGMRQPMAAKNQDLANHNIQIQSMEQSLKTKNQIQTHTNQRALLKVQARDRMISTTPQPGAHTSPEDEDGSKN